MSTLTQTGLHRSNQSLKATPSARKYTAEEIQLESRLSAAANEEGIIQAADMLAIAPHNRPELHTTMSVASAFVALVGKDYDVDFFCS